MAWRLKVAAIDKDVLEILSYEGVGYKTLVDFGMRRVAMLHNIGGCEEESIKKMERHIQQRTVFGISNATKIPGKPGSSLIQHSSIPYIGTG